MARSSTKTLGASGGNAKLKTKKDGTMTIVATVTGPGGTATDSQTVKVKD